MSSACGVACSRAWPRSTPDWSCEGSASTAGVDYGLLDREGGLLANPHSYRDPRTRGLVEQALGVLPADELYRLTGVQPQPINTLYQLLAERGRARLDAAGTLLFIPDLLAYWLTGEPAL
jgi:rhamnulokinase